MPIGYEGQLRYGGAVELECYTPTPSTTPPTVASTADTSVDWAGVMSCTQTAPGQDVLLNYQLEIRNHGASPDSTATTDMERDICRVSLRLRVRSVTLAVGETLPVLALETRSGNLEAQWGIKNDGGTVKWYAKIGASTFLGSAFTFGDWYDLDALYDVPGSRASLDTSPAGADTWTSEISQTALAGMDPVGQILVGAVGSIAASPTATATVEVHSLRWQFSEYQAATTFNGANFWTTPDQAALRTGSGVDLWWAGWVEFDGLGVDRAVLAKFDDGVSHEYWLGTFTADKLFRFRLGSGATTAVAVTSPTTLVIGSWYFVFAWYDAAGQTINVRVGAEASPGSIAFTGTPYAGSAPLSLGKNLSGGADANLNLGNVGPWAFGKPTAGTLSNPTTLAALHDLLYNGGVPLYYDELDPAALPGLVSYWDMLDRGSNPRYDRTRTADFASGGSNFLTKLSPRQLFAPTAAAVREGAEPFVGSRIADVSPTAMAPLLIIRGTEWRGVTHARVFYGTAADLAGGTAGDWTATSGATAANGYALRLGAGGNPYVGGLASDQTYYYRFELSRDGTTAHVQSSIRQCHTLPAVDSTATVYDHIWSCTSRSTAQLPNDQVREMLDHIDAQGIDPARSIFLGDWFYEFRTNEHNSAGAVTPDDFMREYLETAYDVAAARLIRRMALLLFVSDHEVIDNYDSRVRTDATVRAGSASDYDVHAQYDAGVTVGQVWDAAVPYLTGWMFDPRLGEDSDSGTANFDSASDLMKYGRIWEMRLDDRATSRNASKSLGPTTELRGWVDQVFQDFAASTAATLVIISETPLTKVYGKVDSWAVFADTEVQSLVNDLATRLAGTGKTVWAIGGDNHAILWAEWNFETATGVMVEDNSVWRLNLGVSAASTNSGLVNGVALPTDAAYVDRMLHYWDTTRHYALGATNVKSLKSSGALVQLNHSTGKLKLDYWTDYGVHYQPTALQDFALMEAATGGGGGSPLTAGTLTLVSLEPGRAVFQATDASGGTPPYAYQLVRRPAGSGTYSPVTGATSLDCEDTTGEPGVEYDWEMRYTDSAGA